MYEMNTNSCVHLYEGEGSIPRKTFHMIYFPFLKNQIKIHFLPISQIVANKNIHHQSPRRQSRILASFDMGGQFPTFQEIVKWIVFWGTGPRTFIILFALLVLGGILKSLKKLNTWVWKILEFRLQIGTLQKSLNYEEEINRD